MSRIFINYRRQDTEGYVGRVYDHLLQHFEHGEIFMDIDSIEPGADFVKTLEDAVSSCDVFIAVIGPQWLKIADEAGRRRLDQWNDFVRIEIAAALKQNKLVIPVLVGRARMPSPEELPEDIAPLARRNAVELTHQRFVYDMGKFVEVIKTAIVDSKTTPRSDPETLRRKETALKALRNELVNATTSPLYAYRVQKRYFPVIGEGYADANILFIGQALGQREVEEGRPFCGPSGEVLDEMLQGINLKREHVYVTNLVLDRPPENRPPTPDEIAFYAPFVDRLIETIRPAVIVPLGAFATTYLLKKYDLPEKNKKISEVHGRLLQARAPYGEIHIVPVFHPANVFHSMVKKDVLRQDFEKLRQYI